MPLFSSLRNAFRSPAPDAERRRFFRRAAGASAAAIGSTFLIPDEAWAGIEERAATYGIVPGTVVDAQGRPKEREQQEGFIGEIVMFAGNFAPRSWAFCHGQLQAIATNSALFSIIGTTYGGDGRTTMALPDLRGRAPIQQGTGPGLPTYRLGQKGGNDVTTLTVPNLAAHSHNPQVHGGPGNTLTPVDNAMGVAPAGSTIYGNVPQAAATMAPTTNTGSNIGFSNMPPYLAINYIICLQGVYPSRS